MQKRAHFFQHVPFEGAGELAHWLSAKNYLVSSTRFFEKWRKPELDEIDLLIIMGGPMSVSEEANYPWMTMEKAMIAAVIGRGKQVIGICLGAQLLAYVLGARVYPHRYKEIGWYPIRMVDHSTHITAGLPRQIIAFHWHGDTFELPYCAVHLFKNDACSSQGFLFRNRILGLQFHLEANLQTISALIENGRHELIQDHYIQSALTILDKAPAYLAAANDYLFKLLDNFLNMA